MAKKPAIEIGDLLPTLDEITLVDREKKKAGEPHEFTVSMFVPARAAIAVINRMDVVQKMMRREFDEEVVALVFGIFERVFKPQHEFMDAEWCEANIDLGHAIVIITQIALPIFEYLQQSGLLGKAETPGAKNP